MALDAHLGVTQNNPGPEPVAWDVSLTRREPQVARLETSTDGPHPLLLASAEQDVPVVRGGDARQGNYPTTIRPVDIEIIRSLIKDAPSLAGMSSGVVFEQFLNNYNDRSKEGKIPNQIVLYDASTNPALKDKSGWGAATDPALYAIDPNLTGDLQGRNLKPVRDTSAKTNAKSPDSFYVIGYDAQQRPSNVLEYYNDGSQTRYRDQYIFKYDDNKKDGTETVSVFKYRAADEPRGRDNSDAAGTIQIGANHRENKLEGMTQYFRNHGETYAMRKWDGSTMQLGKDELSATPIPSGQVDASGQPTAKFPPIEEIKFDDFQILAGNFTRTIAQGQGNITLSLRDQQLRSHDSKLSGPDALRATFLYAKDFYFYDPFGPNLPKELKVYHPTPYEH